MATLMVTIDTNIMAEMNAKLTSKPKGTNRNGLNSGVLSADHHLTKDQVTMDTWKTH